MTDMQPTVFYDLEFHFKHGDPAIETLEEGRDSLSWEAEPGYAVLNKRHGDGHDELIRVNLAEVTHMRQIRRVVAPAATVQDAGSIRLIGGSDGR